MKPGRLFGNYRTKNKPEKRHAGEHGAAPDRTYVAQIGAVFVRKSRG